MDLDEAADQLYAANPDDFTAARTTLAKQAKGTGDKTLAKQIAALRKPTRSAWLVNLVARAEPDRVTELVELGAALQQAQQGMDGDALRRLSQDRRRMIDALARRAGELGRDQGYPPPDGAIQDVSQSLQAALGDAAIAELVQAGRLASAVTYGGFGPDDLASALAASMPAAKKAKVPTLTVVPDPEPDEAEDEEAREAARQARVTADAARTTAEEAETAADETTTRADDLADQVEEVRRRLRDTEAAEREAREGARAARKHYTELRRAAAAAEQAAVRAEEAL